MSNFNCNNNYASREVSLSDASQRLRCSNSGCQCQSGNGLVHCPAHDDRTPSLSLAIGRSGNLVAKCHAGCDQGRLLEALKNRGITLSRKPGSGARSMRDQEPRQAASLDAPRRQSSGSSPARKQSPSLASKPQTSSEIIYNYVTPTGDLVMQVVRLDGPEGKRITQRRTNNDGQWVWGVKEGWYELKARGWVRLNLAPDSDAPPGSHAIWFDAVAPTLYNWPEVTQMQRVIIAEGEKCVERIRRAIEEEGIADTSATTNAGGSGKWDDALSDPLAGKTVVIAPDNDAPGAKHGLKVCASLDAKAASLKLVDVPGLAPGEDIADYLDSGGTLQEFLALADGAPEWVNNSQISVSLSHSSEEDVNPEEVDDEDNLDEGLPLIITSDRQTRHIVADALSCLIAINDPPFIFERGNQMVQLLTDRQGRQNLTSLSSQAIWEKLTHVANWKKTQNNGKTTHVPPPREVAEALAVRGSWPGLPGLSGLVSSPVLTPDGSLVTEPGFHPASGLYYLGTGLELGDTTPTDAALSSARKLLLEELLGDFPFESDASVAHAMALIILPFVRPVIAGPTPLHNIDAPMAGSGKSLLASCATRIYAPHGISVMTLGRSGEEMRKRLTSVLLEAPSHILFDNAENIDSGEIAAAITASEWKDRILGRSKNAVIPVTCCWMTTTNNSYLSGEIARRTIWIRLDAGEEKPYLREGFRHPDLMRWTIESRAALVTAVLVLIRAWVEAGKPSYSRANASPGSFEAWADVMGGVLETAGIPGFLDNAHALYTRMETSGNGWHGFVAAWYQKFGAKAVGVKEILPLAQTWIGESLGERGERSQSVRLGQALHKGVDRVYGTLQLVHAGEYQRAGQFRIVSLVNVGESGESKIADSTLSPNSDPAPVTGLHRYNEDDSGSFQNSPLPLNDWVSDGPNVAQFTDDQVGIIHDIPNTHTAKFSGNTANDDLGPSRKSARNPDREASPEKKEKDKRDKEVGNTIEETPQKRATPPYEGDEPYANLRPVTSTQTTLW